MLTKIDKYIMRQIFTPLIATLAIAALLLILERMLRLFDFVMNQGGPVEIVWRMLANLMPHYMALALPVGLFLGILLAFRKLSLSSELDAMTSTGVGLLRAARPAILIAVLLMIIDAMLIGWVQPHSRHNYRGLVFDLRSGALGASIRVGDFVEVGEGMVIRIDESRNQGAELLGIFLEQRSPQGTNSVSAARGGFFSTSDQNTILLKLYDGVLVNLDEDQSKPRVLRFEQLDRKIRLPSAEPFRGRSGEELEMTTIELFHALGDESYSSEKQKAFTGNFHWRMMHSLMFLILPFLAIPMGITNKRTGKSSGLPIGLSMIIVVNELMEVMESMVSDGGSSPFTTIWVLFAGFAFVSVMIFRVAAFKVGGDPLLFANVIVDYATRPFKYFAKQLIGARA